MAHICAWIHIPGINTQLGSSDWAHLKRWCQDARIPVKVQDLLQEEACRRAGDISYVKYWHGASRDYTKRQVPFIGARPSLSLSIAGIKLGFSFRRIYTLTKLPGELDPVLLPNPDQIKEKAVDLRLVDLDHSGGPACPVSGDHHSGVHLQWQEFYRLLKESRDPKPSTCTLGPQAGSDPVPKLAQTGSGVPSDLCIVYGPAPAQQRRLPGRD